MPLSGKAQVDARRKRALERLKKQLKKTKDEKKKESLAKIIEQTEKNLGPQY